MITFEKLDSILISMVAIGIAVGLEHMAFRTAGWQARELVRRLVGILTVLMGTLFLVWAGAVEFRSWAIITLGFVVAGVVKGVLAKYDELRGVPLLNEVDFNAGAYTTPED